MQAAAKGIFQVAYVVENLTSAIAHWVDTMGVGPFFLFPLPLEPEWLEVDGQRTTAFDILRGVGLAQSGGVQIELIEPGPDASPYREFLESGRSGVHHVATYADDYRQQMAQMRAAGIEVAMEGVLPMSQFAYLRTDTIFPGTMLELIDAQPELIAFFNEIAQASVGWDGGDPIRKVA